jgi:plastocyanin
MNHITLFDIATSALAVAGFAAGAIAGDNAATPSPQLVAASSETLAADIKTFQFQPKVIEVHAGAAVTWTNQDNIEHTITSGTPEAPDGAFASEPFGKGKSFTAAFDRPGEYAYFCSRHKSMHGTVKVLPAE